jgi:predicted nucleotidyltransferase
MNNLSDVIQEELSEVYKDSGLGKWFGEKWVDVSRKDKSGKHPECGASSDKGKRKKSHYSAYPKCRPKSKASKMSDKEKKNATQRKRKAVKKDKDKSTPVMVKEAEYKGKDVELNKPMRGDVKKYKVYVKDPKTGNVKKVNFGDKNMEIKRDDPERRKSFRARHDCANKKDKTKAGYWSCKFWSTKSVSDLLKEVIEPEDVDVSSIQYHDDLNPLIWEGGKLKEDVRKALLKNVKRFIEFSDLEELKFKDAILTGSMANYNYNENSDLDVHIILDFNQISDDEEFADEFLKMKKSIWNERYPIHIKGHDVEMYYQEASEPHHSTGTYSLIKNDWINEPTKKIVNVDVDGIKLKGAHLMYEIDELEKIKDSEAFLEKYTDLKDKIKKMRQSGLETGGEFSTENLTFKVLRNNGYMGKLVDMKEDYLTKELSLNEKRG